MVNLNELDLQHYSDEPVIDISDTLQPSEPHFKPMGLWFSVDGGDPDWPGWCQAEGFCVERLKYKQKIKIVDFSDIICLANGLDIDYFSSKYVINLAPRGNTTMFVDWWSVSEKYKGIIIPEYLWEKRLDNSCSWYYAWDCASGCVWDTSIIEIGEAIESGIDGREESGTGMVSAA